MGNTEAWRRKVEQTARRVAMQPMGKEARGGYVPVGGSLATCRRTGRMEAALLDLFPAHKERRYALNVR
jgi:hypothetical protein